MIPKVFFLFLLSGSLSLKGRTRWGSPIYTFSLCIMSGYVSQHWFPPVTGGSLFYGDWTRHQSIIIAKYLSELFYRVLPGTFDSTIGL